MIFHYDRVKIKPLREKKFQVHAKLLLSRFLHVFAHNKSVSKNSLEFNFLMKQRVLIKLVFFFPFSTLVK